MFSLLLYGVKISIDVDRGFEVGEIVVGNGIEMISADLRILKSARGYHGRVIGDRCSPVDLAYALDALKYNYKILEGKKLLADKDPLPPGATP